MSYLYRYINSRLAEKAALIQPQDVGSDTALFCICVTALMYKLASNVINWGKTLADE